MSSRGKQYSTPNGPEGDGGLGLFFGNLLVSKYGAPATHSNLSYQNALIFADLVVHLQQSHLKRECNEHQNRWIPEIYRWIPHL